MASRLVVPSFSMANRYKITFSKVSFNPESLLEKIVTRSLEGGGQSDSPPPPSTFDTIHPFDLKFGTYNKLHLYFSIKQNHVVSN